MANLIGEAEGEGSMVRYAAPALDKGLDILELLASESDELSQNEIARRLGRTVNEIFRMLTTLERRGYVLRSLETDGYRLSLRLFELAHRYPPTEQLLHLALPVMRTLAADTGQSVHLAVRDDKRVLVVAQVQAPTRIGLSVRIGAEFSISETTSGKVLYAFDSPEARRSGPASSRRGTGDPLSPEAINAIREHGGLIEPSSGVAAVVNVSRPILNERGTALAALTMPYLRQGENLVSLESAAAILTERAAALSRALGGSWRDAAGRQPATIPSYNSDRPVSTASGQRTSLLGVRGQRSG